jgi:phage terminase large subunit-like protein
MSLQMIEDLFVDFGQGWVSMSPALRTLEGHLRESKLRHGGHPVLKMCAANAVVMFDERMNRTLTKKRSRGRIDGMIALTMAMAMATEKSAEKHVYEVPVERFLETV